jgi:pimeloyl-ACP methyl ester carboxylesterase
VDGTAILHVLDSMGPTPADQVSAIEVPVLVAAGSEDERAGSADELAAVLPHATRVVVPGDHGSAVAAPELATAIVDFLAGGETARPPQ